MYKEIPKFYNYETLEYDRKSRLDDKSLSVEEVLERHGKILEEYATRFLDGPIPEENKYKEVGSSETIDERPEMVKLLKAIESPAIKAVLVVDVQRLSRGDLEDAGRLIRLFRYSNTYVITPMRTYDLRDEYDRDAFERELKKGNEYLEYFKKIQRQGTLASVKEGNYVGSVAPFGFKRVEVPNGKKTCFVLEEKKDEADIVRLIFEWYCNEDIGVTAICRRLESMGVKTKTGSDKWMPSIIFSMLENIHYIGYVRWNWRKTVKIIEGQELKKMRPKAGIPMPDDNINTSARDVDEYMVFKGKHDGIVSEELFKRAAEIRGKRHRTKTSTTLKNPFSGLMYCKCGAKIGYNTYVRNGVEYAPPKLRCNKQVYCKNGSADFNEVLEYVCKTLEDCIADFEIRIDNKQDDSLKLHKSLIETLENKLKDLEARELAQWKSQSDPDPSNRMPQHVFKMLNEELLKEKDEVNKALCKAYESVPKPVDYREKVVKFTDALEALKDPNITAKVKNDYLKDIIERIDYERPPITRLAKREKGLQYDVKPYTIKLTLK